MWLCGNVYNKYNEKSTHVWLWIVLRQFGAVLTTLRQFMVVADAISHSGTKQVPRKLCM